jgi:hypothetical protein
MKWTSFGSGMDVRGRGTIEFKDDLTDVESLSPGGYLILRTWTLFVPRTIELRADGENVARRYFVAGQQRPYNDDARQLLATELPNLVRRSALGAESRTRRILGTRGVNGVLDEIAKLEGDFARRVYFKQLFAATQLDAPTMTRALALASAVIASDFERAQTLRAAAPVAAKDARTVQAYVDSASQLSSDFEHRRALVALLQSDGVPGTGALVLQSISTMTSDFEKGIVIRLVMTAPTTGGTLESWLPAIQTMTSDFEKRRALHAVMAKADLDAETKNNLLAAAADIESDFECATVLSAYVTRHGVESTTAGAFFAAVRTLDAGYESRRVLSQVAKRALSRDVWHGVLDASALVEADHERAMVLLSLVKTLPPDPELRAAFVKAAESIDSQHEQDRVLASLVRSAGR